MLAKVTTSAEAMAATCVESEVAKEAVSATTCRIACARGSWFAKASVDV
jgi:hypothetical protein